MLLNHLLSSRFSSQTISTIFLYLECDLECESCTRSMGLRRTTEPASATVTHRRTHTFTSIQNIRCAFLATGS